MLPTMLDDWEKCLAPERGGAAHTFLDQFTVNPRSASTHGSPVSDEVLSGPRLSTGFGSLGLLTASRYGRYCIRCSDCVTIDGIIGRALYAIARTETDAERWMSERADAQRSITVEALATTLAEVKVGRRSAVSAEWDHASQLRKDRYMPLTGVWIDQTANSSTAAARGEERSHSGTTLRAPAASTQRPDPPPEPTSAAAMTSSALHTARASQQLLFFFLGCAATTAVS